jgi:uncharacterized protein (TIGR00251 family)
MHRELPVTQKLMIAVRVSPRGSRSEIIGVKDGRLRIKTTAPPTDGNANKDVIRQLAKAFAVPPSRVTLKKGATGCNKTFLIDTPQVVPDWVRQVVRGGGPPEPDN